MPEDTVKCVVVTIPVNPHSFSCLISSHRIYLAQITRSWKESCSTLVGANPRRYQFVHVVTVHAEKKRNPQQWPWKCRPALTMRSSQYVCVFSELYFESLTNNYFMFPWISWHKRLISLKCTNSDHIISPTTNKNIFSSIPLGDGIMTLKLNKKSFFPLLFFFFFLTNSLPGGFCHKQILSGNLIYEGNWTSPLGLSFKL